MKRFARSIALAVIMLSLLIPLSVFASEQPPQPMCPDGMIEVVPAEWVEPITHTVHHEAITHEEWVVDVPGHYIYADKIVVGYGPWGNWHRGRCPGGQGSATCQQVWFFGWWHRHRSPIYACPVGYEDNGDNCRQWIDEEGHWITVVDQEAWDEVIVDEEGYWIEPVCKTPAKPVCPLQLLINYNPPEGWLPYCLVLTEGGVSVERQQTLCGWIADNQPCGGMVYDDGTEYGQWACDRYGYYRQPISVLKCLWQRHLNGQRDHESFAKCHEVERPAPGSTP